VPGADIPTGVEGETKAGDRKETKSKQAAPRSRSYTAEKLRQPRLLVCNGDVRARDEWGASETQKTRRKIDNRIR